MTGAMGPNVSFCAIGMSLVISAKICGGSASPAGSPPKTWRPPASRVVFNMLQHGGQLALINNRTDHRLRYMWITIFKFFDVGGKAIQEIVVQLLIHNNAVRTHADLSLVQEPRDNCSSNCLLHVRIV
jgi:hypothetical protein